MVSYTAKLQLPYPDLADTPDVPRDVKALALRLDAIIPNLETYDSRAASDVKAASSNWAISAFHGTKVFLQVNLIIALSYKGAAALKGDASGNLADTHMCTLQKPILFPQVTAQGIIASSNTFGWVYVDSSGRVYIRGLSNGSASLSTNEGCNITLAYPSA